MDWYNEYARRKCNVPDGWAWFEIRTVDSKHMIAKGAVCTTLYKRGPRKGHKNWRWRDKGTEREIVIPLSELEEMKREWAVETGGCVDCAGSGKRFASWSAASGTKHVPCKACNGTGRKGGE